MLNATEQSELDALKKIKKANRTDVQAARIDELEEFLEDDDRSAPAEEKFLPADFDAAPVPRAARVAPVARRVYTTQEVYNALGIKSQADLDEAMRTGMFVLGNRDDAHAAKPFTSTVVKLGADWQSGKTQLQLADGTICDTMCYGREPKIGDTVSYLMVNEGGFAQSWDREAKAWKGFTQYDVPQAYGARLQGRAAIGTRDERVAALRARAAQMV